MIGGLFIGVPFDSSKIRSGMELLSGLATDHFDLVAWRVSLFDCLI